VGQVQYWAGLDVLSPTRVLVTQANAVADFDLTTGKAVGWSANVTSPTSVQRLPNGNTLVNSMQQRTVMEIDREGNTKWEYQPEQARPWKAFRR
jgi:hypothetical protein